MCLSVNEGRVDLSVYFQMANFKNTIPTRTDADLVSKELND